MNTLVYNAKGELVPVIETEHGDEQRVILQLPVSQLPRLRGAAYTTGRNRDEAPRDVYTGKELEL